MTVASHDWHRSVVGWYLSRTYEYPNPAAPYTTAVVLVRNERPIWSMPIDEDPPQCPRDPLGYARQAGASVGYHGGGPRSNPYRYGDNRLAMRHPHIPAEMWPECADAWAIGQEEGRRGAQ